MAELRPRVTRDSLITRRAPHRLNVYPCCDRAGFHDKTCPARARIDAIQRHRTDADAAKELGIKVNALRMWRQRNGIPARNRPGRSFAHERQERSQDGRFGPCRRRPDA